MVQAAVRKAIPATTRGMAVKVNGDKAQVHLINLARGTVASDTFTGRIWFSFPVSPFRWRLSLPRSLTQIRVPLSYSLPISLTLSLRWR